MGFALFKSSSLSLSPAKTMASPPSIPELGTKSISESEDQKSKTDIAAKPTQALQLMNLPTELHLQIASYLTYPDALSLKHTNRHFHSLVDCGIELKVEWLIKRRILHLDCPHDRGCELGSDMRFCRGSVRLLMKRRREHGECETREGGRGCVVLETRVCEYRKARMSRLAVFWEWLSTSKKGREVLWWIVVGIVGVVLAIGMMVVRMLMLGV